MLRLGFNSLMLLLLLLVSGCSRWQIQQSEPISSSPLTPLKAKSEQIVLDIVFVRLAPNEAATVESIWAEVDEQGIAGEARQQLARNGYRVGFLGRTLPTAIRELLASADSSTAGGRSLEPAQRNQPGVSRQQIYLRPAHRAEIVVSEVQPELHALVWNDRGVEGSTFVEGQAQFAIQAEPSQDGRTELRLIPEVHHGPLQQHYAGGEAMFRVDSRRRRDSFDDLAVLASLAPGEVLVLGRRSTQTGTLGDRFFGSSSPSGVAERLLLVRLSQEETDPLFAQLTGGSADATSAAGAE